MSEKRIINKSFLIKSTKVDTEKREFSATITDSSVDRDKEVLLPDGMNISEFKKNGIILFNHDKNLPLGTVLSLRRKGESWVAKGKLAEQGTSPEIDSVWSLVSQGILKAISIGFVNQEGRQPTKLDIKKFGKNVNYVISKFELIEFSIVAVGSNPNALISSCKELDLDPKIIMGDGYKDLEDTIEMTKEETDDVLKDVDNEKEKIIKEAIEELEDVEIKEDIEEKIVEIVENEKTLNVKSNRRVDIKKVMKYFIEEVKKEIKRSKGNLF